MQIIKKKEEILEVVSKMKCSPTAWTGSDFRTLSSYSLISNVVSIVSNCLSDSSTFFF